MRIKKLYWSSSAVWYLDNNGTLCINDQKYPDDVKELFPEFYSMTVQGIAITELLKHYPQKDANALLLFIRQLQEEKILIQSIDSVSTLFRSQNRIYRDFDNSGDAVKASPEERKKFTESALRREIVHSHFPIALEDIPAGEVLNRHSVREFDTQQKVSFHQLSALLASVREYAFQEQKKYLYPSGGGLYPIDIYLFIKENRVENLPQGIYLYVPYQNTLSMVEIPETDFKEAHYFANQAIHEGSAFSVYLVYNAAYSMPKYDGLGYYLGIVDSGIISQALTIQAFSNGLGSCIIGEMNFEAIAKYFHLSEVQKYLHCIEFGLEKKGS